MKILISNDSPMAHFFIRLGICRAFVAASHECIMWDINKKPAFDAFDEFEPDLFIGQSYNLNSAVAKCITERPNMKVIMKGSDWGNISDTIDRQKYPILIANPQEIERIKQLHKETGKPDFLYVHYMEHRLNETHNHWREAGIRVESLLSGVDIFDYTNGKPQPEYKCDIGFLGGRWGYKSQVLDKWLLPLCERQHDYNIKIFGNQPWGISQYCGRLPNDDAANFLSSATICPNLSEPHSQDFGYDVVERVYKLLGNKCFVISDYVEDAVTMFGDSVVFAKTPEEFKEKIDYYLGNPKERDEYIEAGYEKAIAEHTYFERVQHICDKLGLHDMMGDISAAKKDMCEKLSL